MVQMGRDVMRRRNVMLYSRCRLHATDEKLGRLLNTMCYRRRAESRIRQNSATTCRSVCRLFLSTWDLSSTLSKQIIMLTRISVTFQSLTAGFDGSLLHWKYTPFTEPNGDQPKMTSQKQPSVGASPFRNRTFGSCHLYGLNCQA